ncbi:hypothetical protein [Streptomyces sp. NPDC007369]|uniref:hypothetical protein n=1 Tax=Streptomyces sp. NPDC007369 TaxID=3154589 RepID=UPI0033D0E256
MDTVWDFIGKLWDFSTSTPGVALLGILGGMAGNAISGSIQAGGGKEQAKAAVLATEIAGDAQRRAVVREERRIEIAGFVRAARQLLHDLEQTFVIDNPQFDVRTMYGDLMQRQAQLELIAPESVLVKIEGLMEAIDNFLELALTRAPAARAIRRLTAVPPGDPDSDVAHRVVTLLDELRTEHASEGGNQDAIASARAAVRSAVSGLGATVQARVELLLTDTAYPPLADVKLLAVQEVGGALRGLVDVSRTLLGADDPDAPTTATGSIRRWWAPWSWSTS